MATKSKPSVILIVADMLVAYLQRVSDLLHLAMLEAQLALKTIVVIGILIFVLGSILTACWISISALLFFYLISLHYTLLGASSIVSAINFLVLISILWMIYKLKDNLFFPATYSQLQYKNANKAMMKNESITTEN